MVLGLLRLAAWGIFTVGMIFVLAIGLLLLAGIAKAADVVVASAYWEDRFVATGARFDKTMMAAAHKFLPFGTRLTLHHGHRSTVVVINDRGPYVRGRTLDLTPAANKYLQCGGLCRVRVEAWPPLPKPRPEMPQAVIAWGEEVERLKELQ